jgi:hypothetical protein
MILFANYFPAGRRGIPTAPPALREFVSSICVLISLEERCMKLSMLEDTAGEFIDEPIVS